MNSGNALLDIHDTLKPAPARPDTGHHPRLRDAIDGTRHRISRNTESSFDAVVEARLVDLVVDLGLHVTARTQVRHGGDLDAIAPTDATIIHDHTGYAEHRTLLLGTDRWVAALTKGPKARNVVVRIAGADRDSLDAAVAEMSHRSDHEVVDGTIEVTSWHLGRFGATEETVAIDAPVWSDIARNYPPRTRAALDQLLGLEPDGTTGRLMLWHGSPGTGKTTAIRALAAAWADRCRIDICTDAQRLFENQGYFNSVVTAADDAESAKNARLVIVEDCTGTLLGRRTSTETPESMGRLLNACDGLLSHGTNAYFLLTTNAPASAIDPALTRPGRCLAQIDFDLFTPTEASEWLDEDTAASVPTSAVSLAELFALSGVLSAIGTARPDEPTAGYL